MKTTTLYLGLIIIVAFCLSACLGEVNGLPESRPAPKNTIITGRRLIASYGCGSCHSIPGVPGADAKAAPPLKRFYERQYIAGRLPNTWDNLIRFIQYPQEVEPGSAMPDLEISDDEAQAIAAYLYHKLTILDWLSR